MLNHAKGMIKFFQKDYLGSYELIKDLTAASNIDNETSLFQGMSLFHQEKLKEALPFFDQSIKIMTTSKQLKPKDYCDLAFYYRALIKAKQGDKSGAKSDLEAGMKIKQHKISFLIKTKQNEIYSRVQSDVEKLKKELGLV